MPNYFTGVLLSIMLWSQLLRHLGPILVFFDAPLVQVMIAHFLLGDLFLSKLTYG